MAAVRPPPQGGASGRLVPILLAVGAMLAGAVAGALLALNSGVPAGLALACAVALVVALASRRPVRADAA
jgi:hypothetical protein